MGGGSGETGGVRLYRMILDSIMYFINFEFHSNSMCPKQQNDMGRFITLKNALKALAKKWKVTGKSQSGDYDIDTGGS